MPNDPRNDVCLQWKYIGSNSDCTEYRRHAERQSAGTDCGYIKRQCRCKACPVRHEK